MNKIIDLKIYKKLLSLLSAFTIMLTPISGLTEGEKESSKTNEVKVEEMIEEPEEVYERKMFESVEEFDTRKMELRSMFKPLAKEFRGKITEFDSLFFLSNIESCMDILDEILEQDDYLQTKFLTYGNSSRVHFVLNIIYGLLANEKKEADLSEFIYDEKAREEIKPFCDLFVSFMKNLKKNTLDKEMVKDFIELFEHRPTTIGNKGFLFILATEARLRIQDYIFFHVSQKEAEKYIVKEDNNSSSFSHRDGVVLKKDSDNLVELLLYLHYQTEDYAEEVSDEMIEFDNNLRAQQKKK